MVLSQNIDIKLVYLTFPEKKLFNDISTGPVLLYVCTQKANLSLSCSCKGIVKKKSFESIPIIGHDLGNKEGKGILGYKGPIS
jgi:hypothetical protein